ncbi:hypothetical protein U9M48_022568 [Paspalum notatum var. saurae]|uniref:Uncharacterized protein n=1 Tax=Paspalum notatum var. saurae TaxID=547442 RepID=A0AAQ3WTR1_PASNO
MAVADAPVDLEKGCAAGAEVVTVVDPCKAMCIKILLFFAHWVMLSLVSFAVATLILKIFPWCWWTLLLGTLVMAPILMVMFEVLVKLIHMARNPSRWESTPPRITSLPLPPAAQTDPATLCLVSSRHTPERRPELPPPRNPPPALAPPPSPSPSLFDAGDPGAAAAPFASARLVAAAAAIRRHRILLVNAAGRRLLRCRRRLLGSTQLLILSQDPCEGESKGREGEKTGGGAPPPAFFFVLLLPRQVNLDSSAMRKDT